jgi:hypothetical protein
MHCHSILWSEGVKPSKIHRTMLAQYKENCIMQRKVYQWVEIFQSGKPSSTDEDYSSHLTISWVVDNVERVNALLQEDRHITVTYTDKFDVSCGSTYSIIHEDLRLSQNLCKVSAKVAYRWAQICMHRNAHAVFAVTWWRKRSFPTKFVTGNETWLYHYKPASKHQSMDWQHMSLPQTKRKVKCTFCWQSDVDAVMRL